MRCVAFVVAVSCASIVFAEDKPAGGTTIDKGLAFLTKDAFAWKAEHNCASCHHAALVVWAMREAKAQGHSVDETVLADLTKWMAESGAGKVGVARPESAPRALNTKAIYFALGLGSNPEPDAASLAGLKLMRETIRGDQIEDGSIVAWPETRPPFFGESNDTFTTLAALALSQADDEASLAARDKAVQWLVSTKSDEDPQSIAMRLVLWARLGRPAPEQAALAEHIHKRQNIDGGWSQARDMPSDAWATGQALYALASAGFRHDDEMIARGHQFLIKTQKEDGSWPMTSRPIKPDGKGSTSLIPITGGGSAWAVIGLAKSR